MACEESFEMNISGLQLKGIGWYTHRSGLAGLLDGRRVDIKWYDNFFTNSNACQAIVGHIVSVDVLVV